MTKVKDLIQTISTLEQEYEEKIVKLKEQYKQEELKYISELEKNNDKNIQEYEIMLVNKNQSLISKFKEELEKEYDNKKIVFEQKVKGLEKDIDVFVKVVKDRVLSYVDR